MKWFWNLKLWLFELIMLNGVSLNDWKFFNCDRNGVLEKLNRFLVRVPRLLPYLKCVRDFKGTRWIRRRKLIVGATVNFKYPHATYISFPIFFFSTCFHSILCPQTFVSRAQSYDPSNKRVLLLPGLRKLWNFLNDVRTLCFSMVFEKFSSLVAVSLEAIILAHWSLVSVIATMENKSPRLSTSN